MMNKTTLRILVLVGVIIIAGVVFAVISFQTPEQRISEVPTDSSVSPREEPKEKILELEPTVKPIELQKTKTDKDLFIQRLCNNEEKIERFSFSEGQYPTQVLQCGEYYRVYPSRNVLDAPVILIDADVEFIAACGGMLGPFPATPALECEIVCEQENLCKGVVIDCSIYNFDRPGKTLEEFQEDIYSGRTKEVYNNQRDSCYLENFFRTNDTIYCDMIMNKFFKVQCSPTN